MSVGPFAKLELWVGTERFDLLNNKESGFLIREWQPSIPVLKGGGTWADPSTADERELVDGKLTNVEDRFIGDLAAYSENSLILYLRQMRALLTAARQYTLTGWQGSPGFICAQGYRETNPRYTRIKNWRTLQDGFPYGPSQWENLVGSSVEDFELTIEHGAWTDTAPGVGTATLTSVLKTFDARNLGNVDSSEVREPTTAKEVYVGNKGNIADLTTIFVDDGAVFGPNLMDAVLPYAFLPIVPAVGDAVYFGCRVAVVDAGPIGSLVFDVGTPGAGYTGVWEGYITAGPGWQALTVQDYTNAAGAMTGVSFDTAGVGSIHWDWPAQAIVPTNFIVNGVDAYWVRYRITGIPGALTAPTQQNRDVYTITTAYVEMQEAEIGGDLPALMSIKLYERGDQGTPGGSPVLYTDRVIIGLRSMHRGTNFTPYLNAVIAPTDDQNPPGVAVTAGVNTASVVDERAAALYLSRYTPGALALADRVIFTMDSSLMPEYYGLFHVYVRGRKTDATSYTLRLKAVIGSGGSETFSETITTTLTTGDFVVFDLGVISIPGGALRLDETGDQTQLVIQIGAAAASGVMDVADLILMPVDEFAADLRSYQDSRIAALIKDRYLYLDSVSYPKVSIRSPVFSESADQFISFFVNISNGEAIFQANERQRLHVFAMKAIYAAGLFSHYESEAYSGFVTQVWKQQRYWSMRGTG